MKSLPKTLTGLGLILGGAALANVPFLQAASPWIIKLGVATASFGLMDKGYRAVKKQDVLANEKKLLTKKRG